MPRIAGQSITAKRCHGAEREALAGLEPRPRDGVEPRQQDARGKGAIEDDVRREDAAEAEDRHLERTPNRSARAS